MLSFFLCFRFMDCTTVLCKYLCMLCVCVCAFVCVYGMLFYI